MNKISAPVHFILIHFLIIVAFEILIVKFENIG